MPTIHQIRLRGFWTATLLSDGRTQHSRPFQWPRPLPPGETVWVVIEPPISARIVLNDTPQGDGTPETPAGPLGPLLPRNTLTIETAAELGDVRLEVRTESG